MKFYKTKMYKTKITPFSSIENSQYDGLLVMYYSQPDLHNMILIMYLWKNQKRSNKSLFFDSNLNL